MRYKLGQTVYFKGSDPSVLSAFITDMDDLEEYVKSVNHTEKDLLDFKVRFDRVIHDNYGKGLYLLRLPGDRLYLGSANIYKLVTEDLITPTKVNDGYGNPIRVEESRYKKFRNYVTNEIGRSFLITFLISIVWIFGFIFRDNTSVMIDIILSLFTVLFLGSILKFLATVLIILGESTYWIFYGGCPPNWSNPKAIEFITYPMMAVAVLLGVVVIPSFYIAYLVGDVGAWTYLLTHSWMWIVLLISLFYSGIIPFVLRVIFRIKSESPVKVQSSTSRWIRM